MTATTYNVCDRFNLAIGIFPQVYKLFLFDAFVYKVDFTGSAFAKA
ncbi:MAG: hypothetical protein WBA16_02315 [Nonlabens sp.]